MGYVSTVIVFHDELHNIENDPKFGKNLTRACGESFRNAGKTVPVPAGHTLNAARVVDCVHSSQTSLIAVGGNYATVMGHRYGGAHHTQADQIEILRALASKLGYDIKKKPGKNGTP